MKPLLILTALLEAATGLALLLIPALLASLLLGTPLDTPAGLVIARVAGAALLSLGIACWPVSHNKSPRAKRFLIAAMLLYNLPVTATLLHARFAFNLTGIGLWPAAVLHTALALWCISCLAPRRIKP